MKFLILTIFILMASVSATAQSCPENMVCLSQAAANKAAENARELIAVREKVQVLENALLEKDKSISEVRETARKNEADLKEVLHKTEVELSLKTGQLISNESEKTRLLAIIDVLLKSVRPKKVGLINLF